MPSSLVCSSGRPSILEEVWVLGRSPLEPCILMFDARRIGCWDTLFPSFAGMGARLLGPPRILVGHPLNRLLAVRCRNLACPCRTK